MQPRILAALAATLAAAAAAAGGYGAGHDTSKAAASADPASAPGTCSAATLEGTYNYVVHGLRKQSTSYVPFVEVGHEIYDGDGNVATVSTSSLRRTTSHETGTYSLHANCRGQATYAAKKTKHQLFADPSGESVYFLIVDNAGTEGALGGDETRASSQTRSALKCSKQTLTGTYAYHARGLKKHKVYVEAGFETYDGRGKLTNAYIDSHSRKLVHTSGTYNIAADCTGDATYAGGDSYHLYAAPDGSTFSWLQTKGVSAIEVFGGLEHQISATLNYALTGKPAAAKASGVVASAAAADTTSGLFSGGDVIQFPKIDSSYTSYQGALGTSGNEASLLFPLIPLTIAIVFP
jgi:hypothetical protein